MTMKIINVVAAFAVIIFAVFQVFTTIATTTYDGTSLDFAVLDGAVVMTNATSDAVPVQIVGTGSRAFRVSSPDIETGSSELQGTGTSSSQLFEFDLPAGTSEFSVERGSNVRILTGAATSLKAIVNPVSSDTSRAYIIMAVIVSLVALFYASNATEHFWLRMLRPQSEPVPVMAAVDDSAQGNAARAFGDNRSK